MQLSNSMQFRNSMQFSNSMQHMEFTQVWSSSCKLQFTPHSATHTTQHNYYPVGTHPCPRNVLDIPWLQYVLSSTTFYQGTKAPQRAHQCQRVARPGEADHRELQDQHDVLCLSRQILCCVQHMCLGSLGSFTLLLNCLYFIFLEIYGAIFYWMETSQTQFNEWFYWSQGTCAPPPWYCT